MQEIWKDLWPLLASSMSLVADKGRRPCVLALEGECIFRSKRLSLPGVLVPGTVQSKPQTCTDASTQKPIVVTCRVGYINSHCEWLQGSFECKRVFKGIAEPSAGGEDSILDDHDKYVKMLHEVFQSMHAAASRVKA